MTRTRHINRQIFFSLALAATIAFVANADGASGARSLKNFWEGRGKPSPSEVARPGPPIIF